MKNPTKTPTKKSHWLRNSSIAGAVLLVGLLVGWIYLENTRTYPLGVSGELEYVGKDDYGCWWVCDANPASVFYYATNMSLDEVTHHLFKKATLQEQPQAGDASGEGVSGVVRYWVNFDANDNQSFDLYYYENSEALIDRYHFLKTGKRHVISIGSEL